MKIVTREINALDDDVDVRANYIAEELEEDRWVYASPGNTVCFLLFSEFFCD